jgi:D-3-phosphoglycerate dehydrogenase
MKYRALRVNAQTYPVEPDEASLLASAGADLLHVEGQREDELLEAARDCDALLVVSSYVPASVITQMTRCRTIARLGAGTDRIDIEAATRCGIVVSNVPDFCLGEQADHTMALLLAFARRLPTMLEAMRQGRWNARGHPGVHRIAGQTLGLVGFGASAQAVARRAAAFGLELLAWTRSPDKYRQQAKALGVRLLSLDELLRQSHFVSIHLPLTAQTRHLLGARELALMMPGAALLNTSRGAIVDEAALIDCLRRRAIAGAALDVFENIDVFATPGAPPSHPLLELDNVLATPHCAGSSVESSRESKVRGAGHAAAVLNGHWPAHIVNPEVSPRFALAR